jgi:polysaccharide export outer membrane protein
MSRRLVLSIGWFSLACAVCSVGTSDPPTRCSVKARLPASDCGAADRKLHVAGEGMDSTNVLDDLEVSTSPIQLCQAYGPAPCGDACERPISGVDCRGGDGCGELRWNAWGPIPWQAFAQGEYVGPARSPHVPEYHLRVDDEIEFIYRLTREELGHGYPLEVGDVIRVESIIDPNLNREVGIQPDGTIDVLLLGQVRAARLTVQEIRNELNEQYKKFYKVTDINVTRIKTQTRLEDLRAAVDSRFFSGGQGKRVRVTPEGTISLPSIGVVPAQGLTLDEMKREVDARYGEVVGRTS